MKGKDLHPRIVYPAKLSLRMEGQIKCFTDKVKLKGLSVSPYHMKCLRDLSKKRIKTMNSKMTTNSQLSTTESKKQKISKQLEQEENHRNGDHMESYQRQGGAGRMGEKVQGLRSIISRYKIDKGRLRIVWEIVKPKNLYV